MEATLQPLLLQWLLIHLTLTLKLPSLKEYKKPYTFVKQIILTKFYVYNKASGNNNHNQFQPVHFIKLLQFKWL